MIEIHKFYNNSFMFSLQFHHFGYFSLQVKTQIFFKNPYPTIMTKRVCTPQRPISNEQNRYCIAENNNKRKN